MTQPEDKWIKLADDTTVQKTIEVLKQNNIEAEVVENKEAAKKRVLELLPKGAEVMNNTSATMDAIEITKEILESGNYNSIRSKLLKMDRQTQGREMTKLGAAPDYATGSVHAVTEDGHVLIASASGSQLPHYAYTAAHVIWVVGTQKIVKNLDEGIKRIYEHSLPLEDARAQKAYGLNSNVRKILIVNNERAPGRLHLIFVKENLGF